MRYEVLGPLRVLHGGEPVPITAPKMEVLLAALLIRANQVVPLEQLVAEIWGENPPRRAAATVYVYVSNLRKLLADQDDGQCPIETRAPGYMLRAQDDELDLHEFQRLADEGRKNVRAGRHEQGCAAFEAAVTLWRGPALRELREGPIVNEFAIWLEDLRLECTEMLVEASLRLDRHREMVSLLRGLVREQPLHEAFYRQLMSALYRCERRADALAVYQTARRVLNAELGLEPGKQLRELQQFILLSDVVDLQEAN